MTAQQTRRNEIAVLLLRDARRMLKSQRIADIERGICYCLREVVDNRLRAEPVTRSKAEFCRVRDRICNRIERLLGTGAWLQNWLVDSGRATWAEIYSDAGRAKLRQTRLNWIDDLIRYYEGKVNHG